MATENILLNGLVSTWFIFLTFLFLFCLPMSWWALLTFFLSLKKQYFTNKE
uniref:Uncharacterized protein n=1 Tax=Arundo donax TaxID=35708 RepID=A0A0A9GUL5_ARUDO